MSDDDLIRRGDAVLAVTAADKECLGANGARDFIRAVPAVQVGVKPMEWLAIRHGQYFEARVIGILYSVRLGTDAIARWQAGHMGTWRDAPTIEAAKAAAQADYDARIRSALTAQPLPEQVTAYSENDVAAQTFYLDCEFDGHNGPLLSIAMVRGDGYSLHVEVIEDAKDPWVVANVMPIMASHKADIMRVAEPNFVGSVIREFIGCCANPTIIADSPVDIGRFCRAISTGKDGKWQSTDFPQMNFTVRNVDCYPTTLDGAVQHNAWWDAMALRAALARVKGGDA